MNRKINLIINDAQKLEELENIKVQEMGNIFPYSCELLVCKYFNIFEETEASQALSALVEKIRPQGQLILGVIDLYKICNDLINKKINNVTFFDFVKNIHNHFSLDDMLEYADQNKNIYILDINYSQEYITFVTITKN